MTAAKEINKVTTHTAKMILPGVLESREGEETVDTPFLFLQL